MSDTQERDRLADARLQGQAQFDSIREMVKDLLVAQGGNVVTNDRGEEQDEESCRQRIQEDALSIAVRTGWYQPGGGEQAKPEEYEILLCTVGPACRIIGALGEHGEPETAMLQVQDWFTPWTDMRPVVAEGNYDSESVLLEYARCFYFGE